MSKIIARDNQCYCINFRRAANTLTKFYDRVFAPLHLTTSQFSLLNDIHLLGSCNKSELAQFSRLDRTTIIRSLSVLYEKGFIEDETEAGSRNRGVRLTEAGKSAIKEGMPGWKDAQKKIRSVLGNENILALKQVFADIEKLNEVGTSK